MLCQMGTGKSSMISQYIARFSPPTSKGSERVKTAEGEKGVTTSSSIVK
jgi:hypothetical protein